MTRLNFNSMRRTNHIQNTPRGGNMMRGPPKPLPLMGGPPILPRPDYEDLPFRRGGGSRFGAPFPPPDEFMGGGSVPRNSIRGRGGPPSRMMRPPFAGRGGRGLLPEPPRYSPLRPPMPAFRPLMPFPPMMERGMFRGMPRGGMRGMPLPRGGMAPRGKFPKRERAPKKPKKPQENRSVTKPWVNELLKNEIAKKRKLFNKAKNTEDKEAWEEFKEHRNKVTKMLREAKLEYARAHPEDAERLLGAAIRYLKKDKPVSEEQGSAPAADVEGQEETPTVEGQEETPMVEGEEETPMEHQNSENELTLESNPENTVNEPDVEEEPMNEESQQCITIE